jgi:hypothetical protein
MARSSKTNTLLVIHMLKKGKAIPVTGREGP